MGPAETRRGMGRGNNDPGSRRVDNIQTDKTQKNMSDEIKDKGTAETVADNLAGLAQAVAETSPTIEDAAVAVETIASTGSGKKVKSQSTSKGKSEAKPKAKPEAGSALQSVGLDACKHHGLAEVWVTSDGQSFAQQGDAKAHAANLKDKQTINVKAE